jgi:predicted transcriptional regulator
VTAAERDEIVLGQLEYLVKRYASQRRAAREIGVSQGLVSLLLAKKRPVTDDIVRLVERCYSRG